MLELDVAWALPSGAELVDTVVSVLLVPSDEYVVFEDEALAEAPKPLLAFCA